jgi:hypothetical protein
MPTPAPRTPICIARGNLADLEASIADIQEGEICYARDKNSYYQKTNSTLTRVGFSGNYGDLESTPTIGNGKITIKQGGVVKGSFNVNQVGNDEVNLDAGGGGGSDYTLPTATGSRLGGIKVGSGLTVLGDGTLSATGGGGGGGAIDTVTATPGTGITANTSGGDVTLAGIDASTTVKGVVRLATQAELEAGTPGVVPGADLILANGYQLPIATASLLGGFTVGQGLRIDPSTGKLDVTVSNGTVFKGTADFTDAGAVPGSPENGWIYINTTAGTGAWTGFAGEAVEDGVEAIWSTADSKWVLIANGGVGVTEVTGRAPISVDVATNGDSAPIVEISNASEAAAGAMRFATNAQITSGAALVAVQASQLKTALDGLDPLPTGSNQSDLLQWDTGSSSWVVSNVLDGGTF